MMNYPNAYSASSVSRVARTDGRTWGHSESGSRNPLRVTIPPAIPVGAHRQPNAAADNDHSRIRSYAGVEHDYDAIAVATPAPPPPPPVSHPPPPHPANQRQSSLPSPPFPTPPTPIAEPPSPPLPPPNVYGYHPPPMVASVAPLATRVAPPPPVMNSMVPPAPPPPPPPPFSRSKRGGVSPGIHSNVFKGEKVASLP